jgi:hypothetical protein
VFAAAYAKFHDVDTTLPKLIYIAINLAGLAAGCYKCASLGLLPTKPADWLAADNIKLVWCWLTFCVVLSQQLVGYRPWSSVEVVSHLWVAGKLLSGILYNEISNDLYVF